MKTQTAARGDGERKTSPWPTLWSGYSGHVGNAANKTLRPSGHRVSRSTSPTTRLIYFVSYYDTISRGIHSPHRLYIEKDADIK